MPLAKVGKGRTGGGVWHQHQPGGGDMEVKDQGPIPQPQRLL